jgi:hypothetical protein
MLTLSTSRGEEERSKAEEVMERRHTERETFSFAPPLFLVAAAEKFYVHNTTPNSSGGNISLEE